VPAVKKKTPKKHYKEPKQKAKAAKARMYMIQEAHINH